MNTLRTRLTATTLLAALLQTTTSFAQYNQATTNVYAGGAGTNFVDSSATAAPDDLVTFSNALFEAYALDRGGDFHFPATLANGTTVFRGTYGVGHSKRLTFTADRGLQAFAPPGGTFWTVSGNPNGYGVTTTSDQTAYNLAIGPITDAISDVTMHSEQVSQIGFVACSRTHAATYPMDLKATVSYSDGTTESVTSTLDNGRTFDDTFFGFTAPSGTAITNLLLEAFNDGTSDAVATRIGLDDFGFITTPTGELPPPQILDVYPAQGAVHWASNGLHFTARSEVAINGTGVSLTLNETDVSSQLVVTGEPTNRLVSFSGLVANEKYLAVLTVVNGAGTVTVTNAFYTPENPVTIFDSGGFTSDDLYPVGYLTAVQSNFWRWTPATEPSEIVDLSDGVHGKVMRRMQMGNDQIDNLHFSPVSSGTVEVELDARVSTMDARTLDLSLNVYGGSTQGPFIMWGTNALHYYNRTAWVPQATLDANWHHFKMTAYVSGPLAGLFDLAVDGVSAGRGLLWRNVFNPVGTLRIGAIRGALVEFGEVDNIVVRVAPEPLVPLPVALLNPAHDGSHFSFSFPSLAGLNYTAQYNGDLASTSWTPLTTVFGDGTLKTVTHTNPPGGPLFYRIQSELP